MDFTEDRRSKPYAESVRSPSDDVGPRWRGGGDGSSNVHARTGWMGGGRRKKWGGDDDADLSAPPRSPPALGHPTISALLPSLARLSVRLLLGTTVALYVLNQKHMLPKPLSSFVSRALFWPTLPITFSIRIGKWSTVIDDTVIMGGAPFGFVGIPERLYEEYDVRGVINLCDEYHGPVEKYDRMGIQELWLRTVDHFEPSVEDLKKAVSFISYYKKTGRGRVYVHCRAGHGRSAAVTFAWLMYKYPNADPEELNMHLCRLRNVRKTLWKQTNVNKYRNWLKGGERSTKSEDSWLSLRSQRGDKRTIQPVEEESKASGSFAPIADSTGEKLSSLYSESESDFEDGYGKDFERMWKNDSILSTIRNVVKRKFSEVWRRVLAVDDEFGSDSYFSDEDMSESDLTMKYFK